MAWVTDRGPKRKERGCEEISQKDRKSPAVSIEALSDLLMGNL